MREITSVARWSSLMMSARHARSSARSGCAPASSRRAACALTNRRERLSQLVGDRRSELPDAGDAVEVGDLAQVALGGSLGLSARRHVEVRHRRPAAEMGQAADAGLEPAVLATPERRILEGELLQVPTEDGLERRVHLLRDLGGHSEGAPARIQIVSADRQRLLDVGRGTPGSADPGLVGLDDRAGAVDDGGLARERREDGPGEGSALHGGRADQGVREVLGQRPHPLREVVGPGVGSPLLDRRALRRSLVGMRDLDTARVGPQRTPAVRPGERVDGRGDRVGAVLLDGDAEDVLQDADRHGLVCAAECLAALIAHGSWLPGGVASAASAGVGKLAERLEQLVAHEQPQSRACQQPRRAVHLLSTLGFQLPGGRDDAVRHHQALVQDRRA